MSAEEMTLIEPARTTAAPATSDSAVVLSMLSKMTERADISVERMQQVFALYQTVQADASRRAYHAAMAEMQAELPTVMSVGKIMGEDKHGGGKILRSRYAKWEDVNEAIRPVLTRHGFALSFRITQPQPDRVQVTAVLAHRDGHAEETSLHLPNDPSGGKNNVQAWGSSISYGKRYTAFAMLNIASRGEDDDGNSAIPVKSAVTVEDIAALINESGSDLVWFLQHYSVETLDDLTASQRNEIKSKLAAKIAMKMRMRRNG